MKRIVVLLLILLFLMSGCSDSDAYETLTAVPHGSAAVAEGSELLGAPESEEAAQELARLYGIELVSYGKHLSVFTTKENPLDVIARGKANGWPELSLNEVLTAD